MEHYPEVEVAELDFVQRLKDDGRLVISEQSTGFPADGGSVKKPGKTQEVRRQLRTLQSTFAAEGQLMPFYRTGDTVKARHQESFALSGKGVEKGAGDMPDWGNVLGPIEKASDGRILVQPNEAVEPEKQRSYGYSQATLAYP